MVYRVVGDGAPGKAALMPVVVLASNLVLENFVEPKAARAVATSQFRRGPPDPQATDVASLVLGGVFGEPRWCAQQPTLVSREVTEGHGRRARVEKV